MRVAVWIMAFVVLAVTQLSTPAMSANAGNPIYEDWTDATRGRTVPVRLYLPANDGKAHPIVIFSHGLGGSRDAATYLGQYWSEHGYVCIFVQHAGSDTSVWQPVATSGRAAIMERMKAAANGKQYFDRIEDIRFVLDQLPGANQSDPYLKGKLDLSKIAMAGHSFGAGTTLGIAGQTAGNLSAFDPRIKAAIPLCPPVNTHGRDPSTVYGAISIPMLVMTGTEDESVIGATRKEDRRLAFDGTRGTDKYLVIFEGADHMIFGGRRGQPRESDETITQEIQKLTTAFLDAYVKGDAANKTWLRKDAKAYLGNTATWEIK